GGDLAARDAQRRGLEDPQAVARQRPHGEVLERDPARPAGDRHPPLLDTAELEVLDREVQQADRRGLLLPLLRVRRPGGAQAQAESEQQTRERARDEPGREHVAPPSACVRPAWSARPRPVPRSTGLGASPTPPGRWSLSQIAGA